MLPLPAGIFQGLEKKKMHRKAGIPAHHFFIRLYISSSILQIQLSGHPGIYGSLDL